MKSTELDFTIRGYGVPTATALLLVTVTLFGAKAVEAQTAQFIVNSPPELAGSYAAVTYDSPPSNVTSTTPIAQGNIFVYDGVNCSTHTLTKPVAGSGAGKVALLTGPAPTTCTYDAMVRELQADGVVAVVFGFSNGAWRQAMGHAGLAGLTVPVLDMQVDEVAQSIRSAVVSGGTVGVSFVAVPGMVMHAAASTVLAGGSTTFEMPAFATPSTGAAFDFASVDLDRTIGGLQDSYTFSAASCGGGISFSYDPPSHVVTATVPAGNTYTGTCAKTFLIRDTAGFQGIGNLDLFIGVPFARDDQAQVASGGTVSIDVLANDIGDPSIKVGANIDLDPSTAAIDQSVAVPEGLWRVVGNNVEFTSVAGFVGVASIGYVVRGANGGSSNQATITVNVGTTPQIAPVPGVWWNKDESGSGFGLDYANGTLIVEAYSYLAGGASQWYLAAGPVINNTFTATLDKYTGGQCISCAYQAPALSGNDGPISITFTSPTTATVDLPGGRHIEIERYFQPSRVPTE